MSKYEPLPYRDFSLRIGLCLIAAHVMTHFDEHDSIWEALFTKSYWRSFIASFIIAMLVCALIRYISKRLDRSYHWVFDTLPRVLLQFFIGVLLPCLLTLMLVGIYFAIFGRNILETEYIKEDYIVACMMILTLNVFYFGVSLYYQLQSYRRETLSVVPIIDTYTPAFSENPDKENVVPEEQTGKFREEQQVFREVIIVNTPKKSIPVKVSDIAYIFMTDGAVFLRTYGMETLNDSYRLDESMKELEAALDHRMFFRINRQMIVSFDSCKEYTAINSKTVRVILKPRPYPEGTDIPKEHKRLDVVSEHKVADFRVWLRR